MKNFRVYNKQEIFNTLDKLKIERVGEQIITKFNDRVTKIANVSRKYEIFDIVNYIKQNIELIEENFQILKYNLIIKSGQQFIELISDEVEICGHKFFKSFYILNSSDKSRILSFNLGLHSQGDFYFVGSNLSLHKKHLNGITSIATSTTKNIGVESFNEQIELISSLVNHKVKFSKIRESILGEGDISQTNHRKFDAFKNSVKWSIGDQLLPEQRNQLIIPSERLTEVKNDFYLDAFFVFSRYLKNFNQCDSHIIKNETERIMKITQHSIRNSILESLGI